MNDKAPLHLAVYQGRFRQQASQRLCIPGLCTQEVLYRCEWCEKHNLQEGSGSLISPLSSSWNSVQWYLRSLYALLTLEAIGSQAQFVGASWKQPKQSVSLGSVPVSVNEPQDWLAARGRPASLTAVSCPWTVGNQLKLEPIEFTLL